MTLNASGFYEADDNHEGGADRHSTAEDFFGFEPTAPGGALVTNELVEQLLDEG